MNRGATQTGSLRKRAYRPLVRPILRLCASELRHFQAFCGSNAPRPSRSVVVFEAFDSLPQEPFPPSAAVLPAQTTSLTDLRQTAPLRSQKNYLRPLRYPLFRLSCTRPHHQGPFLFRRQLNSDPCPTRHKHLLNRGIIPYNLWNVTLVYCLNGVFTYRNYRYREGAGSFAGLARARTFRRHSSTK